MLGRLKPRVSTNVQINRFHTSPVANGKKVLATRKLLRHSQERLEKQGFKLIQWPHDTCMPRERLLKEIEGAEGLICMMSDKIDKEVFEAAGKKKKNSRKRIHKDSVRIRFEGDNNNECWI